MRRVLLYALTSAVFLACVLSGCVQRKNVFIDDNGIVSSRDSTLKTPALSSAQLDSPTQTTEPTSTPTEEPGWFYCYNRDLVNKNNVLFTLQTIEYDYAAKTLRVVADYTNTGPYEQHIVEIYALVVNKYYSLTVDPTKTDGARIYLKGGEKRTISFSYTFTNEQLEKINMLHLKSIDIQVNKREASDLSNPEDFALASFLWVTIELPPVA